MSDLIPDEALEAARTALWGRPAGDATLVAQMAVEAAAPLIARAAQVAILREAAAALTYYPRAVEYLQALASLLDADQLRAGLAVARPQAAGDRVQDGGEPGRLVRCPVAEIGAEDFRIVRHTHDIELAAQLMQAELNSDCGQDYIDEFGPPKGGRPQQVWCRITPALPNSYAFDCGWRFTYMTDAKPHSRGAFPAVVFHT